MILTKEQIYQSFLNGAKSLINYESYLNEINVFPVRDKDTGTNLTSLMKSIINTSKIGTNLKETLDSISNSALIGSRGNSGLIFSQFIYGMSENIELEELDFKGLIKSVEAGYLNAYNSLEVVSEGTIITIIRVWMLSLKENYNKDIELKEALENSVITLKEQLEKTKEQLPILKKYNVVDSGAKAFTIFVEAFTNHLLENEVLEITNVSNNNNLIKHEVDINNIEFRYCTEVLIKTNLEKKTILKMVKDFGDSLVIGKSNEFYKIHIHTNNPDKFIKKVGEFSTISDMKVDDMLKQYQLTTNKLKEVCIITDSIADIPKEFTDQENIQILPINISIDNVLYLDKLTINNIELFNLINKVKEFPKTSPPNIISVINLLKELKKYYKNIVIISVSSKMSSAYNIFSTAVKQINDQTIKVIDSKLNSVAQGLVVYKTNELINKYSIFEQLTKEIETIINKTEILVHVNNLDNMVRGGRIKKSLGIIAKILRLKPIVSIDKTGEGIVLTKSIGSKRSFKKIIKYLRKTQIKSGIDSYAITHVSNLKLAEQLKNKLINELKLEPLFITEASSVIALNAGYGAVAVSFTAKGD